jgi:hypothetical protein
MALNPQQDRLLSDESVRKLLMRAAELDGAGGSVLSIAQVRQIAIEAGISPHSFETALQEFAPYLPSIDAEHTRKSSSANRPPLWVRLCMFGVPDRRIATGYYWLFVAGLLAFPLLTLFRGSPGSAAGLASMVGGMAFCTFATWSTSRAIRWLDRHEWDLLEN